MPTQGLPGSKWLPANSSNKKPPSVRSTKNWIPGLESAVVLSIENLRSQEVGGVIRRYLKSLTFIDDEFSDPTKVPNILTFEQALSATIERWNTSTWARLCGEICPIWAMTEHYKLPADTTDQLDAIFAIAGEELTISAWYAVCVAELKKRLQAAKKSDATVLKSPLISLGTPDEPGDTTPPVGQIAAWAPMHRTITSPVEDSEVADLTMQVPARVGQITKTAPTPAIPSNSPYKASGAPPTTQALQQEPQYPRSNNWSSPIIHFYSRVDSPRELDKHHFTLQVREALVAAIIQILPSTLWETVCEAMRLDANFQTGCTEKLTTPTKLQLSVRISTHGVTNIVKLLMEHWISRNMLVHAWRMAMVPLDGEIMIEVPFF